MWLYRVTVLVLVFSSACLLAQNRDMQGWINDGATRETGQRLVSLGVRQDVAEQVIVAQSPLIRWESVRTQSQEPSAIMFLPCAAAQAHLYLMVQKTDWRVIDTVDFECYYDDSVSFELASIRKLGVDELVVHHASEGHGTGFSQQNFKIFSIADGKLKSVLDTEEVVSAFPYDGPERHENSVFVVVPGQGKKTSRQIEQTRSILVGGTLSVERRHFYWEPSIGHYVPSHFAPVEVGHE